MQFGSFDSPTYPEHSCTHLCASDENNTGESPLIFMTRPTCRNSCTLPDGSRGIYFRTGMTPPGAFTVVPRRTAPDSLLTLCRFLSEVRGCLPLESTRRSIDIPIDRSTSSPSNGKQKRPSVESVPRDRSRDFQRAYEPGERAAKRYSQRCN